MPSLTPLDRIRDNLRDWYEPDYYASLYRQMAYAFGEPWDAKADLVAGGDDFPDFPAVRVKELEIGRSRRILNAAFVDLAKNLYSDPKPEFPQVDKYTAEVRRAFFLARARQGEWANEAACAFLDGNGLGTGFLQVGFRTNPQTGLQRVHVRHSPTLFTLWDRHERTAGRARGVAFVSHLSVARAVARFGERARDFVDETHEGGGRALKTVRVFEYYDLGDEAGTPTMAVIPQRFGAEPFFHGPSPFPERLPMAFYEHLLAPGMSRAIGRIPLQMATQEGINDLERSMRAATKRPGFDVVDDGQLNPEDLNAVNAGKGHVVRREANVPGTSAYERVPAQEVSQTSLKLLEVLERQFNADSGTSDYDRGTIPNGARTKFEVQELVSRSAGQGGWSDKQTAAFMVRTVETVLYAAALGDRDPLAVDLFGVNLPLNLPSEPRSRIAGFLAEPSAVLVSEESLRYRDADRDRAARLSLLQSLETLVDRGLVDPRWWAKEILHAIGEQDPEAALRG